MNCAIGPGSDTRITGFVVTGLGKTNRKCFTRPGGLLGHKPLQQLWNLYRQIKKLPMEHRWPCAFLRLCHKLIKIFRTGPLLTFFLDRLRGQAIPIWRHPYISIMNKKIMSWRQTRNFRVHGLWAWGILISQVTGKSMGIQPEREITKAAFALQQHNCRKFPKKNRKTLLQAVKRGFLQIGPFAQKKSFLSSSQRGKSEHSFQPVKTVNTPFGIRSENDFSIATGKERESFIFKLVAANCGNCKNFAIKNNAKSAICRLHGLGPTCEINNRKAPVPQTNLAFLPQTFAIRPTMRHTVGHGFYAKRCIIWQIFTIKTQYSSYSAHAWCSRNDFSPGIGWPGYQQVYGHSFEDRTVIGPAFYPLRPFPLARQGLSINHPSASARAFGSPGGTIRPVLPLTTTSGRAFTSVAATGNP